MYLNRWMLSSSPQVVRLLEPLEALAAAAVGTGITDVPIIKIARVKPRVEEFYIGIPQNTELYDAFHYNETHPTQNLFFLTRPDPASGAYLCVIERKPEQSTAAPTSSSRVIRVNTLPDIYPIAYSAQIFSALVNERKITRIDSDKKLHKAALPFWI